MPPSTTRVAPVMYDAASEASHAVARATSGDSPTRPIGI